MSDSNTQVQITLRVPEWLRKQLHAKAMADRRSANTTAQMILADALRQHPAAS